MTASTGSRTGDYADAVPLWQQLQAVAQALADVRAGASATTALEAVPSALRPGVQALLFHVLRWLGQAEALRRKLAPRNPPPVADALLCTALALGWREADAPYEMFTLVDQAVEAAKRTPATRPQSAFINACLRRFLRERETLVEATAREPMAQWNHPRWWIDRLRQDHPRHWQEILRTNATQAPMTLRVNERKTTVGDYLARLAAQGIDALALGGQAVMLWQARPVQDVPGFADGVVSVQDAGAQLAAPLLLGELTPPQGRPLRLLDACAAPGGKTAHLLELAEAEVTALDIDPKRCERIHQNLERLQLQARVVAADARDLDQWWPVNGQRELFDGILLDAPCTASGIVRRHPDVRWLRRESDIGQLAVIQAALLSLLWPLVRPGGRLLYCTCSVFKAEGEQQIQTFLAHNTDAVLRPSPGHLIPRTARKGDAVRDNGHRDFDGFFYALLEKRAD
ncbi:16S rRNA (cytosine(967)-C(5))-methyltransferase RsmB [Curvibacter sp. RS43]|uniref:16S rRNA (cytosine(967)-C(5))-methyltransferase RsmB n=1 Tax=Curvibacter microcysteis TaxID=3026419 RepID=UPI00235E80D4|nr:16S rRNA (cytosine(967)-C(5))-methyltransferase RsmB [Curvibacter sp. RS43]MDD0811287.1 16S rRNA (cytosine(967)-C(5))-methyltransferase RsmB [Curvibacter sp. RS43]